MTDLPALATQANTGFEVTLLHQTATFQQVIQQQREDQSAEHAAAKADKPFSDVYPQAAPKIHRIDELIPIVPERPVIKQQCMTGKILGANGFGKVSLTTFWNRSRLLLGVLRRLLIERSQPSATISMFT